MAKRPRKMCAKLRIALRNKGLFDVSGGCGVDMSNGESSCMDSSGLWFKFCPFCGRQIEAQRNNGWDWHEVTQTTIKK